MALSVLGLPLVEDPCSEAKGREAGSHRVTDGRLKRVFTFYSARELAEGLHLIQSKCRSLRFARDDEIDRTGLLTEHGI